jgi:hypothetical protein
METNEVTEELILAQLQHGRFLMICAVMKIICAFLQVEWGPIPA